MIADLSARLLCRRQQGLWRGRLSSSALATALAVLALDRAGNCDDQPLVAAGRQWLATHGNEDGGWGDTPQSPSNLSTSLLVWAALGRRSPPRLEAYLHRQCGDCSPAAIVAAQEQRYGEDRTFAVPILAALALAGRLGTEPAAWRLMPGLPCELGLLPHRLLSAIRLPVVSYALPALIAIGLLIHRRRGLPRWLTWPRDLAGHAALRRLERMQPASGGFLEATPLTAFVALSLHGAGVGPHPVLHRCLVFLRAQRRDDGSWPIDADLALWCTSLAIAALPDEHLDAAMTRTLLRLQGRGRHPFTGAAPGGWGWSDRPGAVPDADDTAAAVLALHRLPGLNRERREAAWRGLRWLMGIQNRDGGIPTFCRGRGFLPFDRSSPELTAHFLRAATAWCEQLGSDERQQFDRAQGRALDFLLRQQRSDGSWEPLWFGNQNHPRQANPIYGTSRVLLALDETHDQALRRGLAFLVNSQHEDGSWSAGGPGSVEETAWALEALAAHADHELVTTAALEQGRSWLTAAWIQGEPQAQPFGLYFASLWYDEALYPLIFTVAALRRHGEARNQR